MPLPQLPALRRRRLFGKIGAGTKKVGDVPRKLGVGRVPMPWAARSAHARSPGVPVVDKASIAAVKTVMTPCHTDEACRQGGGSMLSVFDGLVEFSADGSPQRGRREHLNV